MSKNRFHWSDNGFFDGGFQNSVELSKSMGLEDDECKILEEIVKAYYLIKSNRNFRGGRAMKRGFSGDFKKTYGASTSALMPSQLR